MSTSPSRSTDVSAGPLVSGAAAADRPSSGPSAPPAETPAGFQPPVWRHDNGAPVSCVEKIKVLNENYAELRQMTQDAFEDALLLGCSEAQVRAVLRQLVDALHNPYPGTGGEVADC